LIRGAEKAPPSGAGLIENSGRLDYNLVVAKRALVPLFVCLTGLSFSVHEAAVDLQKRLASLRSLQADFEQVEYSASISTPLSEKGKFYFQKPDLMRWEYLTPEKYTYVYRGGVSLAYYPDDNQLYRHTLSPEEKDSDVFSILTGKKTLEDNYQIEPASFPTERKDSVQLKLVPNKEGEFSYILLEANEKTWLIEKALFFDWAGNKREFRFSRIKVDPRLRPELFELKVPPGCEVIDDTPPQKK
jgi:outer membrane lipoprotein carrier protein